MFIKLIPPRLTTTQVSSVYFIVDGNEIPLSVNQLKLHHFIISESVFSAATSLSVKVIYEDNSESIFTKPSKYDWIFEEITKSALKTPFRTNNLSSYSNSKEDKQAITDILNKKYIEATNSTIGKKGKQNLLYYSIGGNKEYYKLLKQSIESIFSTVSIVNFDILFICPESWVSDIEAIKPPNVIFKYHFIQDTTDGVEISKNKTKIFEFSDINKYNKILFLDADILAARDIYHIFAADYEHEKIYVKHNKFKVSFSSHSGSYHGLRHLTTEQLDQMKANNQMPFNAGQFLFINSNKMKKHFDNLNWLMNMWPGPYFFEQSFMNHYFCLYNLTDNLKLGNKVKLISTVEPDLYTPDLDKDDILVHFIAPALNATAKVNFIKEYKNAYFPH